MLVSVVVPALNEENYIHNCLDSLLKQDFSSFELIVVDNGSTDMTAKIAEDYADKVIFCKERGIGIARVTGMKWAKSKYVLWTDADCIIPEDWITNHYSFIRENNFVAARGNIKHALTVPGVLLSGYVKTSNFYQTYFKDNFKLAGLNSCVMKDKFFEAIKDMESYPACLDDWLFSEKLWKVGRVGFNKDNYVLTSTRRCENPIVILKTLYQYFRILMMKEDPSKIYHIETK
ncbi:MAG: hypothetical protein MSIBF_02900 [Candidatus Altiarchaeales archaeon IMC4]|nr:MAG: hypothetical protein MSIBF_02900 [Candidatus Altiarchaeales archaeon IMC4]